MGWVVRWESLVGDIRRGMVWWESLVGDMKRGVVGWESLVGDKSRRVAQPTQSVRPACASFTAKSI